FRTTGRPVRLGVGGCVGVLLSRRWRRASRPLRRAIVPLFAAVGVTLVLYLAAVLTAGPAPGVSRNLNASDGIALAAVPIAFLLGLFNARLARAGFSDLVVELGQMPAPGRLLGALSRAPGGPLLELASGVSQSETDVRI